MKILYKAPGETIHSMVIPNELGVMQQLVDGLIEPIYLTEKTALICNEEGKINGMKLNFPLDCIHDWIFGPAFFVGVDGEEFCSLPDEEAEHIKKCFAEVSNGN